MITMFIGLIQTDRNRKSTKNVQMITPVLSMDVKTVSVSMTENAMEQPARKGLKIIVKVVNTVGMEFVIVKRRLKHVLRIAKNSKKE